MIDIHTHVIPALDDGPPDMETSVGMGRMAAENGITTMISTSHSDECSMLGKEAIEGRLDEVRVAWAAEGIPVRLELGVEIFLVPNTPEHLKSGKMWTLAGSSYVLVELPYRPWPTYAEKALFDLQVAGFLPILAHPERYAAIQNDPNVMYSLALRGILSQVTAGALLGDHGPAAQRCSEILVRHGLAQILASDSHGVTRRKRIPALREALAVIERLVGPEVARAMVDDNPARVLSNGPLKLAPQRVEPRKWSLGRIFGTD